METVSNHLGHLGEDSGLHPELLRCSGEPESNQPSVNILDVNSVEE